MTQIIKQAFMTPDGQTFATKQEAVDHVRIPLIKSALNKLTERNTDLTEWLLAKKAEIVEAFSSGKIQRVTKAEKKRLEKELLTIRDMKHPGLTFIAENFEAIRDSFKWPKRDRVSEEDQAAVIRQAFVDLTTDEAGNGNDELVDWLIANKDGILEAYEAGVEKRAVSEKATNALAEYQAAKKAGPEALAAYMAKKKAEKEAAAAAKAAE